MNILVWSDGKQLRAAYFRNVNISKFEEKNDERDDYKCINHLQKFDVLSIDN